jgi:hypothetical protein
MEVEGLNHLTEKIIGCAIEVHRVLGPASDKAKNKVTVTSISLCLCVSVANC